MTHIDVFRTTMVSSRRRKLIISRLPIALTAVLLLLAAFSRQGVSADRIQESGQPTVSATANQQAASTPSKTLPEKPKDRAASFAALLSHLGLGKGSVIADIGAGKGPDTWVLAALVGETGTVYSEEIGEGTVKALTSEAEKRGLRQVRAVQGRVDDPGLPAESIDFAYMRSVYHHFSKPREMLRGIWRALKPGGYLVIVDQRRGTLRDWVPREQRKDKHSWIAETTVVREAREEGFLFVECAEDYWHEKEPFVLVFQRPKKASPPGRDPDPFRPLRGQETSRILLPVGRPYQGPVFIALGESREWIAPVLKSSSGKGIEIVLEEWATQRDERPPMPDGVTLPAVLTNNGDPQLDPGPIDVVFFLDSYHLLFHGKTLLAKLHERLPPHGCIYVMDREAKTPLSRREASHRRQIAPAMVKQEMAEAGFVPWFEGPSPAPDRFLLVFGKTAAWDLTPENDPFFGGPDIPRSPAEWLGDNAWRLRGLRTADGKTVALKQPGKLGSLEKRAATEPGTETWAAPDAGLLISFQKKGQTYRLTECRPLVPK